jgi:hypothetical protein
MTVKTYLSIAPNKFEAIHILRKFLTNFFTFKQNDVELFLENNLIPNHSKKYVRQVLLQYVRDYKILENDLTIEEKNLTIKNKLSNKKTSLNFLDDIKYDITFLYAEDADQMAIDSINEFSKNHTVYSDCLNKNNFKYHSRKYVKNLLLSNTEFFIIISDDFIHYWIVLGLDDVLNITIINMINLPIPYQLSKLKNINPYLSEENTPINKGSQHFPVEHLLKEHFSSSLVNFHPKIA